MEHSGVSPGESTAAETRQNCLSFPTRAKIIYFVNLPIYISRVYVLQLFKYFLELVNFVILSLLYTNNNISATHFIIEHTHIILMKFTNNLNKKLLNEYKNLY